MILGAKDAPFMKKVMEQITDAFDLMREDVLGNGETPLGNRYVSVRFPRKLYFFMGNYGWMSMARQNGLQKKDLYLKPYRDRN